MTVETQLPALMFSCSQGSTTLRSVNIPGDPLWEYFFSLFPIQPRAHPIPQEMTPARVQAPCLPGHNRGPPESPWKKAQQNPTACTAERALKSSLRSLSCLTKNLQRRGQVFLKELWRHTGFGVFIVRISKKGRDRLILSWVYLWRAWAHKKGMRNNHFTFVPLPFLPVIQFFLLSSSGSFQQWLFYQLFWS